ncbi:ArsC family reductase [Erwinia mallotivora]|uniref:ArsC family reductase n=1 Tax=Erwinia mallotivora TaxID=69222 RepID=UPI0035ECA90F
MENPTKAELVLYGIKNCDTVKKARKYLESQGVDYQFHDYRTDGLDASLLDDFITHTGWEALLNTRGTTWRKLSEETRNKVNDAKSAAELMLAQPAMIKRPLLRSHEGATLLGFSESTYQSFIAENA